MGGKRQELCQWGFWGLLISLTDEGKNVFLWSVVLVLIDLSFLPEGIFLNVHVQDGWDRSQSFLPISGFWRHVSPVVMANAGNHLLCRADEMLKSDHVLGGGSSIVDGGGEGEDGLDDGCVEVHHHCPWQTEVLQLP